MDIKRYRFALVGIIILVIITSIFAIYYKNNQNNKLKNEFEKENIQTNISEYMYYLKEYNSQIGVYRASEDEPFKVIEVYTFNLPSVDQHELRQGIYVEDEEKLNMIIEDYES